MKMSAMTQRLAGLGGAKWEINTRAKLMIAQGKEVLNLTIGEPDVATPESLIENTTAAMLAGRTGYSDGQGELNLREALADRYSKSTGRTITPAQIMCFPGTQTALFNVLCGVSEEGDEVIVGDPLYATYEGVIRTNGAKMVTVALRPEKGFRLQAEDIAPLITPRTIAIVLNTPHNPTGAILTKKEIDAIGSLAKEHDLWIISDEVYDELIFDDAEFSSPLHDASLEDRTIVVSSISKSHAAPGFRSGWSVSSEVFAEALLPLAESMLFGNQPFIADMTATAIRDGSSVAAGMKERFANRAARLADRLSSETDLVVNNPQAGMFALVNVSATGKSGLDYATDLLDATGVAVMPGTSFGDSLTDWVRVALTIDDSAFDIAIDRMIQHYHTLSGETR